MIYSSLYQRQVMESNRKEREGEKRREKRGGEGMGEGTIKNRTSFIR